jgi:hypothetical protein
MNVVADAIDQECHSLYGQLVEGRKLEAVCAYIQTVNVDHFLDGEGSPLNVPKSVVDAILSPASGSGLNDVGCPKNQWVSGYTRADGTYVAGYYRNSPSDGCGGG